MRKGWPNCKRSSASAARRAFSKQFPICAPLHVKPCARKPWGMHRHVRTLLRNEYTQQWAVDIDHFYSASDAHAELCTELCRHDVHTRLSLEHDSEHDAPGFPTVYPIPRLSRLVDALLIDSSLRVLVETSTDSRILGNSTLPIRASIVLMCAA